MTGALSCRRTHLTGCDSDGNALVADGIKADGEGVLLDNGFSAAGAVRLPRADITGALAVMMNFLTTPDAIPQFAGAIQRLMRRSLVPGGTILVLGGVGGKYREIYPKLDQRAPSCMNVTLPCPLPYQDGVVDILSTRRIG